VTVAAVVLAAGEGSRFTGATPKLLAPFRGRPLVVWAVEAALGAAVAATFVVTGAVDVAGALAAAGLAEQVTLVANPRAREGQATSVGAAVAAAGAAGHDAVVIGLGDQPLIPAEAWRRVASADADRPIVVATYAGQRRNPVRLDRSVWPELPADGDAGARLVMARRPELVSEVACPGEPADVDTQEDLARWS
jgi:molybdenum cofactor cytidylyltransferase